MAPLLTFVMSSSVVELVAPTLMGMLTGLVPCLGKTMQGLSVDVIELSIIQYVCSLLTLQTLSRLCYWIKVLVRCPDNVLTVCRQCVSIALTWNGVGGTGLEMMCFAWHLRGVTVHPCLTCTQGLSWQKSELSTLQ